MRANVGMSDRIRFGLFFEEKQIIAEAAARRGLSIAEFVRQSAVSAAAKVAA
jgi:uncharacterized protein (DUF1778 family)